MPNWNPRQLARHHKKRIEKDQGCFEDLHGIAGRTMTVSEYELRCDEAYNKAWGEYEGEARDVGSGEYSEARAYFVDDDLIVAITDGFRHDFITCFHEHFDSPHGADPGAGASVGQKRLRYKERLKIDEQGKMIRNVRRIRGV